MMACLCRKLFSFLFFFLFLSSCGYADASIVVVFTRSKLNRCQWNGCRINTVVRIASFLVEENV